MVQNRALNSQRPVALRDVARRLAIVKTCLQRRCGRQVNRFHNSAYHLVIKRIDRFHSFSFICLQQGSHMELQSLLLTEEYSGVVVL